MRAGEDQETTRRAYARLVFNLIINNERTEVINARHALDHRVHIRVMRLAAEIPAGTIQPAGQRMQKLASLCCTVCSTTLAPSSETSAISGSTFTLT